MTLLFMSVTCFMWKPWPGSGHWFSQLNFVTNRATRPALGERGAAYCSTHFLGCSKKSADRESLEFKSCLKMCTNSFYPVSSNHLVRTFSKTSLGDPFKSCCFPVSWLWCEPANREVTERREQRLTDRAGETSISHCGCWLSPDVPRICSGLHLRGFPCMHFVSGRHLLLPLIRGLFEGAFVLFLLKAA